MKNSIRLFNAVTVLLSAFVLSSSFNAAFAQLAPGTPAPNFEAKNQDGKVVRLSDFKGQAIALFFYPKDFTPGCTKQACSFRDEYSKFKKAGAVVLGVSRQDGETHQEFRKKHALPYDLLVDEDGVMAKAFGVGSMPLIGFFKRTSVLIGKDAKIVKIYESVDAESNAKEMLGDLSSK